MNEVENKKKISIHQSQYLPWSPYFKKIKMSDCFVILDDVQFQKNGVQNRNKIRNKNSEFWLTIPVNQKLNESINVKQICDTRILFKHWKTIEQSYSKTRNWLKYKDQLFDIYSIEYKYLGDLNNDLLTFFVKELKIKTPIIRSSSLKINEKKSELVLKICEELNADIYISGVGSKNYLDETKFADKNIDIHFMQPTSPKYKQLSEPFIANLSVIDFIMNGTEEEIDLYFSDEI